MGEHKLRSHEPTAAHQRVRAALLAVLQTEGADLHAQELLAVVSHTLGQLIALQDHRTMTPAMAMEIVGRNIEEGNRQATAETRSASGPPQ